MTEPLRIAVIGVTGTVGSELIGVLEERRFPVHDFRAVATERSLGEGIDLLGLDAAVEVDVESLRTIDRVFVCTPESEAVEWVRRCLQDEARCIDVTGVMSARAEVALAGTAEGVDAPLVSVPPPAALALGRVLEAIASEMPGLRVTATCLVGVGHAGRAGVDALQAETIALFNQSEFPEPSVFDREVAFDAAPFGAEDPMATESRAVAALERLVPGCSASVAAVRIPVFSGLGIQVSVQADQAFDVAWVRDALAKTPGIVAGDRGVSTREALGSDAVHVGPVEEDPGHPGAIRFWLAADPVRLVVIAAVNAAEADPRSSVH